jgi:hypothetical protein
MLLPDTPLRCAQRATQRAAHAHYYFIFAAAFVSFRHATLILLLLYCRRYAFHTQRGSSKMRARRQSGYFIDFFRY